MTKSEIRAYMLQKRFEIISDQHHKLSLEAVKHIQAHPYYQNAKVIGLYHPIKNEINLLHLIDDQKTFSLPVVEDNHMHYRVFKKGDRLTKSTLEILEPQDHHIVDDDLELIIVPALAVNKEGHRIGYGKGFFDQFINTNPHIKTITVVFDFQVLSELPVEKHDQQIQTVIVLKGEHHDC